MKHHVSFDLELRKNPYKARGFASSAYTGLYIALEGIDGSGKTTQAQRLTEEFERKGKQVVRTREPRDEGVVGSLIRKILHGELVVPSVSLQYLYTADRAIHHKEVIEPSLEAGKVVISDRCFWSAIPYGILDRGEDYNAFKKPTPKRRGEVIEDAFQRTTAKAVGIYNMDEAQILLVSQGILSMYHQFIVPDHTFYLRLSLPEAMRRIKEDKKQADIYEDEAKLRKIMKGYEWLVGKFPQDITVIDGEQSVDHVTAGITSKLK